MAPRDPRKTLYAVLRLVLKPIIRFCLRKSLYIQDILEAAKKVFIETAAEDLEKDGIEVTISRLRMMTGIHRKDVQRIYRDEGGDKGSHSYITGVIGQWLNNTDYLTSAGKPKVLTCDTEDSEFNELVRSISTDVHPNSVLFELERVNAVNRTKNGVKLQARMYLPKGDPIEIYRLYARDVQYLMDTVEDNAFNRPETLNLHLMTEYDNVCLDELPKVKEWLLKEGTKFHKKARDFISKYDLDVTPNDKKIGGGHVFLGAFGRAYDIDEEYLDEDDFDEE